VKIAIIVPKIAYSKIEPKFLKKYCFSILIAPSYKIAGKKTMVKNDEKPDYKRLTISKIPVAVSKIPKIIPINVVNEEV
jgi:hypothetical protein